MGKADVIGNQVITYHEFIFWAKTHPTISLVLHAPQTVTETVPVLLV